MRLDIHIHVHEDDEVRELIETLVTQGEEIMAKFEDVDAKLDVIVASVTGVSGDVADLKKQIEDLKNAGGGATPAQVDALFAKVSGIADSLSALDASTPGPAA